MADGVTTSGHGDTVRLLPIEVAVCYLPLPTPSSPSPPSDAGSNDAGRWPISVSLHYNLVLHAGLTTLQLMLAFFYADLMDRVSAVTIVTTEINK